MTKAGADSTLPCYLCPLCTPGAVPVAAVEQASLTPSVDELLYDFQRACEDCWASSERDLREATMHRAGLRNELRKQLLAARAVEAEREAESARLDWMQSILDDGHRDGNGCAAWRRNAAIGRLTKLFLPHEDSDGLLSRDRIVIRERIDAARAAASPAREE